MKTDKELKALANPIVEIYNNIEHDLLLKIAEFLTNNEELTIKNSLDWYFSKLEEMGALNSESIKILSKYTNISENEIKQALKNAGFGSISEKRLNFLNDKGIVDISWDDLLKSKIINNAINTSFTDTREIFKMINTKALESTKKAYMDALNQARLEIGTGLYDYNTAISRAIEKMVDDGISGATYKRKDGTIYNMSLESVVRRDMITAIYQSFNSGSEANAKVMGAEYYEVSSHLGARLGDGKNPISNHYAWQGKVYKIDGSDNEYDNFYEKTGYGDILGLSGVNCRHKFWAFFPGIDILSQEYYDEEENRKQVELQNKQRACERKIRKMRTKQDVFSQMGDDENYQKWKKKEQEFIPRYNKFLKDNNLYRDYAREHIVNSKVKFLNEENVSLADKFKVLNKNKEHMMIFDVNTGKQVMKTINGKSGQIDLTSRQYNKIINMEKESLFIVHNHPNNTSFSITDIKTFNNINSIGAIGVVTDKYTYLLSAGKSGKLKLSDSEWEELSIFRNKIKKNFRKKYDDEVYISHLTNEKLFKCIGWEYERKDNIYR